MAFAIKRGDKWYYKFKEWQLVDGQWQAKWTVKVGSHSKRDTLAVGKQKEDESYARMMGLLPTEEKILAIKEALDAYEVHLKAARNTPKYVALTVRRLEVVFNSCGITSLNECGQLPTRLPHVLAPMTASLANHYKTAVKGFLRFHKQFTAASDIKKHRVTDQQKRRALTAEEIEKLCKAAENSPKVVLGLTGRERSLLYRVAAKTGLRAGELAGLRPSSFRLEEGTVYVPAAETKNGKDCNQPLPPPLLELLKVQLPKATDNQIWPGNWYLKAAKMLRHDLAKAEIEAETPDGIADFHALRVSYITSLARAGVSPALAQKLARHSTVILTLETYTRFTPEEMAEAVKRIS